MKSLLAGGNSNDEVWRLKDGEAAHVRFLTEPSGWSRYYEHFDASRSGSPFIPCIGRDDGCTYCDDGVRSGKKFLANIVDLQTDKARVIVLPQTAADFLYKRWASKDTIMDRPFTIEREGSGKDDTTYTVDHEAPSRFNTKRFEIKDLEEVLQSMLDGPTVAEDDDDDEPSWSRKKKKSAAKKAAPKKAGRRTIADEDDDDDDDDEDERPSRRPVKSAKKAVKSMRKGSAPSSGVKRMRKMN